MMTDTRSTKISWFINGLSWVILFLTLAGIAMLYIDGYLAQNESLANIIKSMGVWGPILFVLIQILQVAIPVLPGGVTTVAGVAIFGPFWGFVWNYVGICIGSLIGFALAKTYGKTILRMLFSPKTIETYEKKTGSDSNFAKYFAWAIFLPVAPDDFLCYLAGTTSMSYKTFIKIILLAKPASILAYSLGLAALVQKFLTLG